MKKFSTKINYLLLGISVFLFMLPAKKALSRKFPFMLNDLRTLNYSYGECKTKANEVASFALREYQVNEFPNNTAVLGRTASSRSLINCVKRSNGVFVIVVTTTDFDKKEATSLQQRIVGFMDN